MCNGITKLISYFINYSMCECLQDCRNFSSPAHPQLSKTSSLEIKGSSGITIISKHLHGCATLTTMGCFSLATTFKKLFYFFPHPISAFFSLSIVSFWQEGAMTKHTGQSANCCM